MKKLKISTQLVCLAIATNLFLLSCSHGNEPIAIERPELPVFSSVDEHVIYSSNQFSMEVMSRVNETNENNNVFISPFSISTALSMTLNGAAGDTKAAIREVLQLGDLTDEEINDSYKKMVGAIRQADEKAELNVANSNWYKDIYSIRKEFETTLLDYYDAEIRSADFSDAKTKDLINEWIAGKTNDKIKNMLDQIPSNAVMYLINAIYFKADWTYQFEESETSDQTFHVEGGAKEVPTMYSAGTWIGHASKEDHVLVDLPYGNGRFSFTAVMPIGVAEGDINSFISEFTMDDLTNMLKDTVQYPIEVYLPKFKIAFKQTLNDVLIDMGMGIAFGNNADFSKLFEEDLSLGISSVLHQSFLEVNEEGSEAAAATIVGIEVTSVGEPVDRAIHLDKPFLFFIRENHSNTILFAGKLLDPSI